MKNIFKLIIAIAICQTAGVIGSFFTFSSISGWYQELFKPSFTPPGWLFGPVWILLYTLMGISLYLLWKNKKIRVLFLVHLAFNALWSIVFFGLHQIFFAFLNIVLLDIMIFALIILSWRVDRRAAYLFLPYFLWTSFATVLNFSLYLLN